MQGMMETGQKWKGIIHVYIISDLELLCKVIQINMSLHTEVYGTAILGPYHRLDVLEPHIVMNTMIAPIS